MRYVVIVEKEKNDYGAYVPDLPGCVAVGKTKKEVLKLIREAIELHLESMQEEGLSIPEPTTSGELMRYEYMNRDLCKNRKILQSA